jgi:hypothetical protein
MGATNPGNNFGFLIFKGRLMLKGPKILAKDKIDTPILYNPANFKDGK